MYAYCDGNPVNLWDPSGCAAQSLLDKYKIWQLQNEVKARTKFAESAIKHHLSDQSRAMGPYACGYAAVMLPKNWYNGMTYTQLYEYYYFNGYDQYQFMTSMMMSMAMMGSIQDVNKLGGVASGGVQAKNANLNKIADSYLKKNGLNAHSIKTEYLGKTSISLYDLAVDKKTGAIWIIDKLGKAVEKTYYTIK